MLCASWTISVEPIKRKVALFKFDKTVQGSPDRISHSRLVWLIRKGFSSLKNIQYLGLYSSKIRNEVLCQKH